MNSKFSYEPNIPYLHHMTTLECINRTVHFLSLQKVEPARKPFHDAMILALQIERDKLFEYVAASITNDFRSARQGNDLSSS